MTDGWNEYFTQFEHMFSYVESKTVLDIGCSGGLFWPVLSKYNPSLIEGLDPDTRHEIDPAYRHIKIHNQSYEDFLPRQGYDVILSFGLIYKLSDPIGLIERIANSNPKHIIFENIMHWDTQLPVEFFDEDHNLLGGLVYDPSYKKVPWALLFPPVMIEKAFSTVGYDMTDKMDISTPNLSCKKETCVMVFKKKD